MAMGKHVQRCMHILICFLGQLSDLIYFWDEIDFCFAIANVFMDIDLKHIKRKTVFNDLIMLLLLFVSDYNNVWRLIVSGLPLLTIHDSYIQRFYVI